MAVQDDSFELLDAYNLGDDYYWDERALFNYKGKTFGFIECGSASGYIAHRIEIGYVKKADYANWLHAETDLYIEEYHPSEKYLIKYAEKLLHSDSDNYMEEDEE